MSQVQLDPGILSGAANKTVLVTGAARGIGAATAALFNHHGANVVIADLAQFRETAEQLIQSQFSNPERVLFIPGNIVDWAQLTACFKIAVDRFGGIDIVVANAGIMESSPVLALDDVDENGSLLENDEAGRVIDVNLKGTLNSMPHCSFGHCGFYLGSTLYLRL
ncbi:Short-chain dehydrogenase/reductase SDR [Penicillium canariense]|uniref:Short-chain dehydrogenase/reductase SDR n=1 Tax=Penicillium canariense TaxID=189055 RepID=A0A9W9LNK1_9EURO|nr:Short-chain dehydrogenase/reductase SDR [Penicillium canariense]KAJ5166763.1 Short-chain dehydrogenase/reductase SDR [Penicillium canariense]